LRPVVTVIAPAETVEFAVDTATVSCVGPCTLTSSIWTSSMKFAFVGDPTLADGIFDRRVHNAHRIEMRGDSMSKNGASRTDSEPRRTPLANITFRDHCKAVDPAQCRKCVENSGLGSWPEPRLEIQKHSGKSALG